MDYFQSTIVVSTDTNFQLKYISSLLEKLNIKNSSSNPDIIYINSLSGWGIDQIRSVNTLVNTPPIKSKNRLIVIQQAQNLTTESQNSILKTLEEPPSHTFFLLFTDNLNSLLDTIKSRCTIINSPYHTNSASAGLTITSNLSQNLAYSSQVSTDKQNLINLLKNQILTFHKQLLKNPNPQIAQSIRLLHKSLAMIDNNVNPTSALDFFFLSL